MVVATFAPSSDWVGRTITYEDGRFTLEGYGAITAADVLTYDRQGQISWAYAGLREWVQTIASASPVPAASQVPVSDASPREVQVLMRLSGSRVLSNTWKQEMLVTNEGVEGEAISGMRRTKMHLPYDRIAQVNLVRGPLKADLKVVNKGGSGNLVVKALKKEEAEKAKSLIEQGIQNSIDAQAAACSPRTSVADEVRKLAQLRDEGLISAAEFEVQRAKLLTT